jgi:YhcH/YjgK/YiaL family protein
MIITALESLSQQVPMSYAMQMALDFLKTSRTTELQPGRVEIDSKNVYALIQTYETTLAPSEVRLEAHRQYIDLQYIVAGVEVIGWAHISGLQNPTAYDAEKDVWFGTLSRQEMTPIRVTAGQAAIFYPEDAHAPKLAFASPGAVVKVVVKVRVSQAA